MYVMQLLTVLYCRLSILTQTGAWISIRSIYRTAHWAQVLPAVTVKVAAVCGTRTLVVLALYPCTRVIGTST